ncbi:hypothetical protein ACFLY7_02745 [Patescibacteria group bacterium]
MKKVTIAGSSKLQEEMNKWVGYWDGLENYTVIDYPNPIDPENFDSLYPKVLKDFFENITKSDILFVALC